MSKFRARQLDATKPIPIYFQEDISDCSEFNNVTNRTVPQLPTGMEKEEETEHHLQQAIFHHRVIPVPEVYSTENEERGSITYDSLYPPSYKAPRQMIHIHPFSADQDIPDYDLDSEDDEWLKQHTTKGDLLPLDPNQFEEMMDRLEKASGLKAVTLQEAKLLLKDDDDLITAVYDYWLNKRLRLQHPLIPQVKQYEMKSEKGVGSAPTDPYVAFRKRTEKMQTRKNRKNDETSFEKMLKLRRDLQRAVTLVEMVKRREKSKRELLHLNIELVEKRFEMEDFNGAIINEISAQRLNQQLSRPAFTPITPNHKVGMSDLEGGVIGTGSSNMWLKVPPASRSSKEESKRERRPYKKKRKHHQQISVSSSSSSISSAAQMHIPRSYVHPPDPYTLTSVYPQTTGVSSAMASEDEVASHSEAEEDLGVDGYFTFRRKPLVKYHSPRESFPNPEDKLPKNSKEKSKQFFITSLSHPTERFIGFARRRIGRGGRMWLDRIPHPLDDLRIKSDIMDEGPNGLKSSTDLVNDIKLDWPHYHPTLSNLADTSEDSEDAEVDVETVSGVPPSPCLSEGISHSSSSTHLLGEDGSAGIGRGAKEGTSSLGGGLPSSFYMTAEMLDGSQEGLLTDLQVTLPPLEDIDLLSVVEDSGEEVDVLSTGTHSQQSDTVTSVNFNNNNNITKNSDSDTFDNSSDNISYKKGGIHNNNINNNNHNSSSSSTKWTLTNCDGKTSCISVTNSNNNNNINNNNNKNYSIHSIPFNFQTQPSSRFLFSDTGSSSSSCSSHFLNCNNNASGIGSSKLSQHHSSTTSSSHTLTGDESLRLGIHSLSSSSICSSSLPSISTVTTTTTTTTATNPLQQVSLSSCTLSSSLSSSSSPSCILSTHSSSVLSSSSPYVKNLSSSAQDVTASTLSPLTTTLTSSSPLLSSSSSAKTLSVSSCLATSLNNPSISCASLNFSPVTTATTNTKTHANDCSSLLEQQQQQQQNNNSCSNKKFSSLYIRQQKDRFHHLDNFSSGLLLNNSKTTNGNNGLSNSKSALVSQKLLTWTNENLNSSEDNNSNSLISNGPSSKSIDSLKCPKVTPVLYPET